MLIYVETVDDFKFLADREEDGASVFISVQQRPKEDMEDLRALCCGRKEIILRARVPIHTAENLHLHFEGRARRAANIIASGDSVRIEPLNELSLEVR